MKQAGQKSVKEELPKQRKGPKRTEECRLKVPTHILESQQVYRVTPLDPHERVFGSTGQLCYRKRWGIYCRYNGIPYITPYELRHTFSSIYKNHFSNWVYEELVGHTHPGVNGVYMHPMDGDMDGVPALLDSLLDERLSLGRAKRMLLSNGQTK